MLAWLIVTEVPAMLMTALRDEPELPLTTSVIFAGPVPFKGPATATQVGRPVMVQAQPAAVGEYDGDAPK